MKTLVKISCCSILYILLAISSVTEGSCWRYGHSCWGGHGKRSGPSTFVNHIEKPEKPSQVSASFSPNNYPPLKYGILNSMGLLLRGRESKKGVGLRDGDDEKIKIIDHSLHPLDLDDDGENFGKEVDVFIIENEKSKPNESGSGNEYSSYESNVLLSPEEHGEELVDSMESGPSTRSNSNGQQQGDDESAEIEINTRNNNKFSNPSSPEDQRSKSQRGHLVLYRLIISNTDNKK